MAAPARAVTFVSSWTSTETDNSRIVAWGDYDNDGDLDQLVGNSTSQSNRVYRNDGGGAFTLVWTSSETDDTRSVAWGDYDGDGDLDQLVGNSSALPNRVYRNDGGSVFTLVWSSTETDATRQAVWGDYDNDGDLDQLVGNFGEANRVYRNDGGGVFTLAWSSAEVDNTVAMTWGDYDNDGDLDQLVGNYGANRVYRNDGGGFTLVWSSTETDDTEGVAWGDCDGDGDLDQLVGNYVQTNRVYRNDGGGAFTMSWNSAQTDTTTDVAWGDYDGDGDLDQLVGNFSAEVNRIYSNSGGGSFTLAWSSTETENTYGVAWGDYDGDGDLDQLTSNANVANRVYRNDGGPTNTPPPTPVVTPVGDGVSGSFNLTWTSGGADDHTPAALITYNLRVGITPGGHEIMSAKIPAGPGNVGQVLSHTLFLSDSGSIQNYFWSVQAVDTTGFSQSPFAAEDNFVVGTPPPPFSQTWGSAHSEVNYTPQFGDLDGDGDLDMAVPSTAGAPIRVYLNNGAGAFSDGWSSTETEDSYNLDLGDVDNDGDLDIAVANNNNTPNRVYKNNGAGSFTLFWTSAEAVTNWDLDFGDYDNDGDLDLAFSRQAASPQQVYRNDGTGNYTLVWSSPNGEAREIKWADLDGNGVPELVVSRYNEPNVIYAYSGNDTFTQVWASAQSTSNTGLDIGDYDNDGDMDLLFAGHGTVGAQVYRNDGAFSFTLAHSTAEAAAAWGAKWGDFDADGLLDFVVANNAASTPPSRVYKNLGGDNFTLFTDISVNSADGASWGDADGDGDLDLAFASQAVAPRVFTNDLNPANGPPSAPGLMPEPDGVSGSVSLNWSPSADDHTPGLGITYNLRVGTSPGGNEVFSGKVRAGLGSVGSAVSWSLYLSDGGSTRTYYWSVQAVDNTGFLKSGFAAEDSFVVAGAPPDANPPPDVLGVYLDGPFQTSTSDLSASWLAGADDPETGTVGYEVQLWDNVPTLVSSSFVVSPSTMINFTNLTLVPGVPYTVKVKAKDGANNLANGILSPPTGVENTPPTGPTTATDDGATTANLSALNVMWDAANDPESGLFGFDIKVGTTPGGGDVVSSYFAPGPSSASVPASLTPTVTYYLSVAAINGAGMTGSYVTTDGIQATGGGDGTPPTGPTFINDDGLSTSNLTGLSVSWDVASDGESGVTGYVFKVGTTPGGSEMLSDFLQPPSPQNAFVPVGLTPSQIYYVSVAAVNGAGLTGSYVTTDGITADTTPDGTPPTGPTFINDDGLSTSNLTGLSVSWDVASDGESGITGYVFKVGTTPGGSEMLADFLQPPSPQNAFVPVGLTPSQIYYVSVAAINGVGLTGSYVTTDGITAEGTPDGTPPTGPTMVVDEGDTTGNLTGLSASWDVASDPESGVTGYVINVGTLPLGNDVMADFVTPGVLTGSFVPVALTVGQTYFISVAAINGAGLTGSFVATDGITAATADLSPPLGPTFINDEGVSTSNLTGLSVSWDVANDPESFITGYVLNVGVTPGGMETLANFVTPPTPTMAQVPVALSAGQIYYVSVAAVNAAGVTGSFVTTDGITAQNLSASADTTPPSGGMISYPTSPTANNSIQLLLTPGTDDVGLSSSAEIRGQMAGFVGEQCGPFGPLNLIVVVDPFTTTSFQALVGPGCYRYEYVVYDLSGNAAVYTAVPDVAVILQQGAQPGGATGPSGGGIGYPDGPFAGNLVALSLSAGTDPTGLNPDSPADIAQAVAPYDGAACGLFAPPQPVLTVSASQTVADIPVMPGQCYQFSYTVADMLGNPTTYTSSAILMTPPQNTGAGLVVFPVTAPLGLVTPGSFSLDAMVNIEAVQPLQNVRLLAQPLAQPPLQGASRSASTLANNIPATMIVADPFILPLVEPGSPTTLLVKVMTPHGLLPGHYEGMQSVYADQNGDGQWGEGEPVASFLLSVEVPDFSALGATCPVQDMTLQDPPAQSTPARQAPGSEGGAP